MAKVIIEVEILKSQDEFDPEYTVLDEGEITVRGEDLTSEQLYGLAEAWGQSDWFYVDFTAAVLEAMG